MAYAKGYLTHHKVNAIQNWALSYWLYEENKKSNDKQEDFWKMFTMLINPELYGKVYQKEITQTSIENNNNYNDGSGDVGYSTDNIDEIEAFMRELRSEHRLDEQIPIISNGDWV